MLGHHGSVFGRLGSDVLLKFSDLNDHCGRCGANFKHSEPGDCIRAREGPLLIEFRWAGCREEGQLGVDGVVSRSLASVLPSIKLVSAPVDLIRLNLTSFSPVPLTSTHGVFQMLSAYGFVQGAINRTTGGADARERLNIHLPQDARNVVETLIK
jgi:hypothetical protein